MFRHLEENDDKNEKMKRFFTPANIFRLSSSHFTHLRFNVYGLLVFLQTIFFEMKAFLLFLSQYYYDSLLLKFIYFE